MPKKALSHILRFRDHCTGLPRSRTCLSWQKILLSSTPLGNCANLQSQWVVSTEKPQGPLFPVLSLCSALSDIWASNAPAHPLSATQKPTYSLRGGGAAPPGDQAQLCPPLPYFPPFPLSGSSEYYRDPNPWLIICLIHLLSTLPFPESVSKSFLFSACWKRSESHKPLGINFLKIYLVLKIFLNYLDILMFWLLLLFKSSFGDRQNRKLRADAQILRFQEGPWF